MIGLGALPGSWCLGGWREFRLRHGTYGHAPAQPPWQVVQTSWNLECSTSTDFEVTITMVLSPWIWGRHLGIFHEECTLSDQVDKEGGKSGSWNSATIQSSQFYPNLKARLSFENSFAVPLTHFSSPEPVKIPKTSTTGCFHFGSIICKGSLSQQLQVWQLMGMVLGSPNRRMWPDDYDLRSVSIKSTIS